QKLQTSLPLLFLLNSSIFIKTLLTKNQACDIMIIVAPASGRQPTYFYIFERRKICRISTFLEKATHQTLRTPEPETAQNQGGEQE
ncbi:hypothetical protein IJH89_02150, partial [Candidatus Saccharibacteria bacterium]|nr:hypothetical protein [Candidatus Saccharibacteria bacterium]